MSRSLQFIRANLAALALITAFCAVQAPSWADYQNPAYQRGLEEMKRRDYDGAINSFGEAIGFSMAEPKLYFLRGQCFFNLHNFPMAITDFDHYLKDEPHNADVLVWKGTAHSKLGQEEKAVLSYLQAMRANPKLVEQYQQGTAEGSAPTINAKNEGAVHDYEKAVKLYLGEGKNSELVDRPASKVEADSKSDSTLKPPQKRIEDLDDAIRLDPSNPGLYFQRGKAYKRLGDLDHALSDFTEAIRLNPMIAPYYLQRARVYHEQHKTALCQSDIKKAQSVDPHVPKHIKFVEKED